MYKLLGLVLVLFCSSLAYAMPSAYFLYASNSQGELQLKVRGVDLCDSQTFRIRVTDDLTGDSGWYKSERGNTEWAINNRACTLNMFLARKYLVPGYTLEVRTYSSSGRKLHSFSTTIPCEESRWATEFSDRAVYETVMARPISCGGQQPPVYQPPVYQPPQQQPPPAPSCNANVVADNRYPTVAKAYVSCNQNLGVSVSVYKADGSLLCENQRFFATTVDSDVCAFNRDPSRRLDYKVRVNSAANGALLGSSDGTVVKGPTYNFSPQGTLVSDRYVQPPTQNKALGRGQYWDVSVKALVADGDVDPSENQRLIKVELIEVINGVEKVIKNDMANSGQTVEFKLEHEYVVPKLIGKPHEAGDLRRGVNTLKVRVWDAYQGSSKVDLPEVTVVIPN